MANTELKENVAVDGFTSILEGAGLTDEVKLQVATLFEAAVATKVSASVAEISESLQKEKDREYAQVVSEMVEACDKYMSEAVAKWLEDNKLVIENEAKVQRADRLFEAVKAALASANMQIDESAENELSLMNESIKDKNAEIVEMNTQMEAMQAEMAELQKQLVEFRIAEVFAEISEGLADTQKATLKSLTSAIYCESIEEFRAKATAMKAALFSEKKDDDDEEDKDEKDDLTDADEKTVTESVIPGRKTASVSTIVDRFAEMLDRT